MDADDRKVEKPMTAEYQGDLRKRLHAAYDRSCSQLDRWHQYDLRRVRHVPLDNHALEMHFELVGTNVSPETTTYLPLSVSADSPADFDQLGVAIRNRDRAVPRWKDVPAADLLHDDPYCKIFKVHFDSPVPRRGPFNYEVELTWPGTAATRDDYVFAKYNAYLRGVTRAEIDVLLPAEPDWQAGFLDDREVFALLDDVEVEWIRDAGLLRWRLDHPRRDGGYVLLFRRTSI
jgi:hypothetical protein